MSKSGHKNISRIDQEREGRRPQHGWFVRVTWKGKTHSKWFADGDGDDQASLQAAIEWRNKTEQEIGKPRTDRQIVKGKRKLVGVRRVVKVDGDSRRRYYEVTWAPTTEESAFKYFSIDRLGEEKALADAKEFREKIELEVYGVEGG